MITIERAKELRAIIEAATAELDDKTASGGAEPFPSPESVGNGSASGGAEPFPTLSGDGSLVKAGTRINWKGALKRAAVDLWDTAENTPDAAPTLWEDIAYRDGIRIIPETITAGLAFANGELGYWGDSIYKSKLDSNVWTPAQYPDGWELVS